MTLMIHGSGGRHGIDHIITTPSGRYITRVITPMHPTGGIPGAGMYVTAMDGDMGIIPAGIIPVTDITKPAGGQATIIIIAAAGVDILLTGDRKSCVRTGWEHSALEVADRALLPRITAMPPRKLIRKHVSMKLSNAAAG